MADKSTKKPYEYSEEDREWYQNSMKNWRAWGSWFSWGSPIGLSIFLLSLAGIVWILAHLR